MQPEPSTPVLITAGSLIRIAAVGALIYLLYYLRDIALVVLTAVVIASAVEPAARLGKRYGMSRLVTVIGVYGISALLFAVSFYFFMPVLIADLNTFLSSLPKYVDSISIWNPLSDSAAAGLGKAREIAEGVTATSAASSAGGSVLANLSNIISALSKANFIEAASLAFGGLLSLVLIVVLSFYLAVQEEGIEKFLRIVVPRRYESYAMDLWRRSQEKIALWAQGQFVLALLVGILVYLGLQLLGVRNAMLFALLAAVFEVIPLFGPILAAIPAVAVSFVDAGISGGLLTVGLYVVIQQFENHLIYPLVVQKIVGVPPIIVIIALIAGFQLAGFLGMILSVPLATILVEVLNDFERHKAEVVSY